MSDLRQPDVMTVAVTRADGGLTVLRVITTEYQPTTPEEQAEGLDVRVANWTIDPTPEYVDGIIAKHGWTGGLAAVSWRLVPNNFVDDLTDRTFRNAWKDDGGAGPAVDMPQAREIHRDRLRRMRTPLLEQLDVDYMKATEPGYIGPSQSDIANQKQALRDVPADPAIDAAQTPDELKAVIPEVLRG